MLMVHGLQSTPVSLINLVNDLCADPEINGRYQIWQYHYRTGTPVLYNAAVFRRMGSITKHGNPRLRRLMVELAWRVSRLQPSYRGVLQWGALLHNGKVSAAARKKAIVALARRLAVDLCAWPPDGSRQPNSGCSQKRTFR